MIKPKNLISSVNIASIGNLIKIKMLVIAVYATKRKIIGTVAKVLNGKRMITIFTDKRKYTIYAVDFDGTLCESIYPGIGIPNMTLIEHLKKRQSQGNKIILWTCRVGERLQEAVEWCRSYGLEFDAVNDNMPEMIEFYGNNSRKVFADVYIDDKMVNKAKYCVPYISKEGD